MSVKKTATIGSSLLLGILALGSIFISRTKEEIEREQQQMMAGIRQQVQTSIHNGEIIIDSLLKEQGTVYLYSNDSKATAGWLPNLRNYNAGNVSSYLLKAGSYDEFIAKKDSLGFLLYVKTGSGDLSVFDRNTLRFHADSTRKRLWFLVHDSKDQMPHDTAMEKRYPWLRTQRFSRNWAQGFNTLSDLQHSLDEDVVAGAFIPALRQYNGMKLYMIGSAKEDIQEQEFAAVIRMFNQQLRRQKLDTMAFRATIHQR